LPATATWLSSVSTDWNTPSGWSTDDVPNSIAIVALISEPGSYTVSITVGESFAVGGVILSSASTAAITGTLEVSGGTLDNTGLFSVGDIGTGTLVVDGGGLVAETQNDFDIGTSVGSYGTVVVDGGTLDTPGGSTNVGDAGTGALSVNGGTVSANGLDVGAAATGSGFATIANGLLSTDGGVVGNNGTGTLSIGAGGTVMSGPGLEIGEYSTGQGTVIVNAGTLEAMNTGYNAGITVGVLGTGTLIVENSGLVEISANEGSNSLSVGDAAAGVMEINSGGVAGAQIVSIGGPYGGNGTVTVGNGGMLSGSEIDVSNSPTGTSSGTLTVETGGSVFASNLIEGADGTVTINGSVLTGGFDIGNVVTGLPVMTVGSLGVVNNYFGNSFVGKATAGVLTVQAGGTVTGNGANVLNIQHGGTVMVNGGTLGGYGDIAVGGIQDAPNIGTLAAAAGTLEGTLVTVGDGGLVEATTATIGTAITQGDIGTLAIDAGGTVVLSSVTLSTDALLSLDLLLLDGGSLGPAVMIVSGAATIDGAATIEGTGTLEIGGSITGAGTLDLKGALTLQLDHGTSGGPAVMFQAGVAQTVILGTPFINSTAFAGMTVGLNALIDLGKGFAINAISYAPGTVGQNVTLDVTEGETSGTIAIDNVQFIGGAREFFITTNPTTGDAAIETIASSPPAHASPRRGARSPWRRCVSATWCGRCWARTRRRSSGSVTGRLTAAAIRNPEMSGRCALPPEHSVPDSHTPTCSCRRTTRSTSTRC
jgi:hypothetical protein